MNKNIFSFSVLLPLLFLIPACVSTGSKLPAAISLNSRPSWVENGHHNKFPEPFYLTGTGLSSLNRQKADDMARQELAKQVRVRINGMDEVMLSERKELKKGVSTSTAYSDVSSEIRVSVDQELEGVRIAERWFDKKRGEYYSYAILNREEAAAALTKKIEKAAKRANSFYQQGLSNLNNKKYIPALKSFFKGERAIQKSERDILARRVVSGEFFTGEEIRMPEEKLARAVTDLLSSLRIRDLPPTDRKYADDITGENTRVFGVFYEKEGVSTPVSNTPMLIVLNNSIKIKRETGRDGLLRVPFSSLERRGSDPQRVEISFDLESILRDFPQNETGPRLESFSDIRASFSYEPESSRMPVLSRERAFKFLASGLVSNISDISNFSSIRCVVADFIEVTSNNRLRFSRLIENELKTALTLNKTLPFNVIDHKGSGTFNAPFLVTGGYILKEEAIKINVKLVEISTNIIISAAEVLFDRREAAETDFVVSGIEYPEAAFPNTVNALFPKRPDKSAFNIKIWTDKKVYVTGETVVFRFMADRDCYLTLLDLGTSGNISYLFPNEYQKESFIKKGVVYSIPGKGYGFRIKTEGPPGVERVKAIASLTPLKINQLNSKKGFFSISPEDGKMARDLRVEVERLLSAERVEGYYEFFIKAPKGLRYRGLTEEKPDKPEKPIDIIGTQGVLEERAQ